MANKNINDLPNDISAEKAVLGSALLSNEAAITVLCSLDEDDFYSDKNRAIYHAMKVVRDENHENIDSITVTSQLVIMKEIENVGGLEYLKECSDAVVALGSLDFYIHSVKDNAILRNMITAIRKIEKNYESQNIENINDFISASEDMFKNSINKRRISDFAPTSDVADLVREKIANSSANNDGLTGITTGYQKLNEITQGFRKGEVIILAARPGVGKTAFALNLALKTATISHKTVGIFSLEMDKELLFRRLIAAESGVYSNKINTGNLNDNERMALANAINKVSEASIYIDDTPSARLNDIIQKTRNLQQKKPDLGLIVIDYIGLITMPSNGRSEDARHNEVRKISAALKGLALELKIPILVLCQLNRNVEDRDNQRPMMSDLRDSGSIEQDADIILLMYRGDYYNEKKNTKNANNSEYAKKIELAKEAASKMPGSASYVELNVAKNRNGRTGNAFFFFFKDYSKFEEPGKDWYEKYANINNSHEE